MSMTLMTQGDTDNAITIAAGMHDDTLPMGWQDYADRPDWAIRQVPDPDPLPPEDDGMAPTVVLERGGTWGDRYEVVETYNMEPRMLGNQLATWLDGETLASVATDLDERDADLSHAWEDVLPRFARIFWGLTVVVHPGPGNYWYVSVITPTWAEAVGVEVSPEVMKRGNYDEVTGWLNGEASYLELVTWDPIEDDYVTDDVLGGFYGEISEADALDAFGFNAMTAEVLA